MAASIQTRVVQTAARVVGDARKLRDALGVSSSQVACWIAGTEEPPREVVMRAVELILDALDSGSSG